VCLLASLENTQTEIERTGYIFVLFEQEIMIK